MIRRLRGVAIERSANAVVVDVQGVGYLVAVPKRLHLALGATVDIHVHTHVRDDAIQLFGFLDDAERELFDLLISVPGIGPVKAIGILETPPAELVGHVRRKDLVRLSKLPGVGKKTAERLVLDLHDKVLALRFEGAPVEETPSTPPGRMRTRDDLVSALVNLGFRPHQAEAAATKAVNGSPEGTSLEVLLKETLGQLTQRSGTP
ncbi:MAG: Holliday junction branch migration protein RuvA [Myxococcota bacterium]